MVRGLAYLGRSKALSLLLAWKIYNYRTVISTRALYGSCTPGPVFTIGLTHPTPPMDIRRRKISLRDQKNEFG